VLFELRKGPVGNRQVGLCPVQADAGGGLAGKLPAFDGVNTFETRAIETEQDAVDEDAVPADVLRNLVPDGETWFLMFASSAAGAPRKNLART